MLIVGKTQSGKSTLATAIATGWRRVLIFDPKHDPNSVVPGAHIAYSVDDALAHLPGRVVWRPAPREHDDLRRHFDRLVGRVMTSGGAHGIVIHELRDVSPESGSLSYLSAAYRQGASRRIPMLLCTQRPRRIDLSAVSEASQIVLFRVDHPADITLAADLLALDRGSLSRDMAPYSFYLRDSTGVVRLMPPIAVESRREASSRGVLDPIP